MDIDAFKKLLSDLGTVYSSELRKRPYSVLRPVEERFAAVSPTIEGISMDEWALVRDGVNYALAYTLFGLSIRMASAAVRQSNSFLLWPAILALILDKDYLDPRDVYVALTVLWDASARLGTQAEEVIGRASKIATAQRARVLDAYLGAGDFVRSLKSMGVDLINTVDGPHYAQAEP
jgi:hypothetical protein